MTVTPLFAACSPQKVQGRGLFKALTGSQGQCVQLFLLMTSRQKGSRGTAPFTLNLRKRQLSGHHTPAALRPKENPLPTESEAG